MCLLRFVLGFSFSWGWGMVVVRRGGGAGDIRFAVAKLCTHRPLFVLLSSSFLKNIFFSFCALAFKCCLGTVCHDVKLDHLLLYSQSQLRVELRFHFFLVCLLQYTPFCFVFDPHEICVMSRFRPVDHLAVRPSVLRSKNINAGNYTQTFQMFVFHTCRAYRHP